MSFQVIFILQIFIACFPHQFVKLFRTIRNKRQVRLLNCKSLTLKIKVTTLIVCPTVHSHVCPPRTRICAMFHTRIEQIHFNLNGYNQKYEGVSEQHIATNSQGQCHNLYSNWAKSCGLHDYVSVLYFQ